MMMASQWRRGSHVGGWAILFPHLNCRVTAFPIPLSDRKLGIGRRGKRWLKQSPMHVTHPSNAIAFRTQLTRLFEAVGLVIEREYPDALAALSRVRLKWTMR
jgi:hypothetical protein